MRPASFHPHVVVGPSPIAGLGCFAVARLGKRVVVADYTHDTDALTRRAFLRRYPTGRATHVWLHRNGLYYDATGADVGKFNRAPAGQRNNLRILQSGRIVTQRAIRAGEELTVGYGSAFRV